MLIPIYIEHEDSVALKQDNQETSHVFSLSGKICGHTSFSIHRKPVQGKPSYESEAM